MATGQLNKVIEHLCSALVRQDAAGLPDGDLLQHYVRQRDEAAFEALLRRHGPMVLGVCRRVLRNAHDAEDAFQATFLVLVRKAAALRSPGTLGNWLYGVAYRTALEARRLAARRRAKEAKVAPRTEEPVDGWADWWPVLDQELERLPEKYRAVLVLCDLEGKTRKEAARDLGWPEGTVASRLASARSRLAKRLARHGLAFSGGALAALLSQNASAGLPTSVVSSTIKAAGLLAAGRAAGLTSAKVAALTEGVLKAMLLAKLKTVVLVGALSALALGLGLSYHGSARQPGNEGKQEPNQRAAQVPANPDADKPDDKESGAHYCWLVFGPNGKARALVRLDGEEVAVDRDGDGKFDGEGERFQSEKDCKGVVLADPDGRTSYVVTSVRVLHVIPPEKFLAVRVRSRGPLDYPQEGIVQMTEDRKDAPQAHFNGPLTIAPKTWGIENRASRLVGRELLGSALPNSLKRLAGKTLYTESMLPKSLSRAGEPTNVQACLVTEGESSLVAVVSPDDKEGRTSPLPQGVRPFVDVEFPAKQQGDPPIKRRYPLDHTRGGIFRGPVRVPDEAGVGKARVTFSLDSWRGVQVAPTTVEIPIDEPGEEKGDQKQAAEPPKGQGTTETVDEEKPLAAAKSVEQAASAWFERALLKAAEDNLKHAKRALQDAEMSYFQLAQNSYMREQLLGRASVNELDEPLKKAARERMERARADLKRAERNLELAKEAQTQKEPER